MEIKSGEGGEESALFAGDLLKMYSRYAETRGWKVEVLDAQETDLGGYKSVTVAIKAPRCGEPDQMPYGVLKFEGGVHRVQRVPVTESQGRVHTSAAGVLVMPEVEETEVDDRRERPADRRLPLVRSRRPGRQHHRLRGPDHPPAERHRGLLPERALPAAEPRAGDADAARPADRRRRGAGGRRGVGGPPQSRSARSTARSGSAPTTSRRTGSPTTGSASRPTTSTRC